MSQKINSDEVKKVGKLANLPLKEEEIAKFAAQFSSTLEVVDELQEVDTKDVVEANEVHGLTNITRDDEIDFSRVLTQQEALQNASNTHNGYFIVPRIIDSFDS